LRLRILSVAYPFSRVSFDAVGGAEQVVATIDAGLTESGHDSIVIACEGSEVRGELLPMPRPNGTIDDDVRARVRDLYRERIEEAIAEHAPDVVHLHGLDAFHYLPDEAPTLWTLHLPRSFYEPGAFDVLARDNVVANCVSEAQNRTFADMTTSLEVVPNGIRLEDYALTDAPDTYALVLGRICPEKGQHLAIEAAKLADVDLLVAGQVHPYVVHEDYFRREVVPLLDERRRFVGPWDRWQKRRYLGRARCLLIPSLAPETSSLVAMEALASGTPVIAHRVGALVDIVEDGETGFLVDGVEEMAEAIHRVSTLSRARCRQRALERFSATTMVSRYFDLYERRIAPREIHRWRRSTRFRTGSPSSI